MIFRGRLGATANARHCSDACGEVATLVVSKVANFSIDLPEAAVAVQVSGTFGHARKRRNGSAGRPKADGGGATSLG